MHDAAGFIGRLGRQGFKQHTGFTYIYKRWILNDLYFWGCLPVFLLETKGYKTRQNMEGNLTVFCRIRLNTWRLRSCGWQKGWRQNTRSHWSVMGLCCISTSVFLCFNDYIYLLTFESCKRGSSIYQPKIVIVLAKLEK